MNAKIKLHMFGWWSEWRFKRCPVARAMLHGNVHMRRSMTTVSSRSRRRCHCGCRKRATHLGLGGNVALVCGCELYIRRWVRDGAKTRRAHLQHDSSQK